MSEHRLGARFQPSWEPEALPAYARALETAGYDELWFSEDCFWAGSQVMAATALAHTTRLTVGIGLLPAVMRNAALAAMELGALSRLAPDRLVVAFGHGIPEWMEQIGATVEHRLAFLEEMVIAVRDLLAGEQVDADGRVVLRGVRLGHPPRVPPPVLVGTTGPRGLRMASRASEGIVLPEVCTPEAVRWARGQAAADGGLPRRTVVFSLLSLDDDAAAAIDVVRPDVQRWAGDEVFAHLTRFAAVDERPELDDEGVRAMAVAGDQGDCARAVEALWDAGADTVVLIPRSDDGPEQVQRFADEVAPRLRR